MGVSMVSTKIEEIKISAMAAAVSNTWTALTDMETQEDPEVIAKFSKKTGVKGRYDANLNQTTADFCFAAAKAILKEKKISPDEIGILVFVTQSADYKIGRASCRERV